LTSIGIQEVKLNQFNYWRDSVAIAMNTKMRFGNVISSVFK